MERFLGIHIVGCRCESFTRGGLRHHRLRKSYFEFAEVGHSGSLVPSRSERQALFLGVRSLLLGLAGAAELLAKASVTKACMGTSLARTTASPGEY